MKLMEVRRRKLWTAQRLAEEAGVSRATIYGIEKGRNSPTLETMEKLATALGVDPQYVDEFRISIANPRTKKELAAVHD